MRGERLAADRLILVYGADDELIIGRACPKENEGKMVLSAWASARNRLRADGKYHQMIRVEVIDITFTSKRGYLNYIHTFDSLRNIRWWYGP